MNLHFIKTGDLSKEDGSVMASLFIMRHTGDYDDIFDWEQSDAEEMLPKTKDLLEKFISLINKKRPREALQAQITVSSG